MVQAEPFSPQAVSLGLDYRISFDGSTRIKPETPTFGFNLSMQRIYKEGNWAGMTETLSHSTTHDKLIDMRFDSKSKGLRNLYVGGINALVPIQRLNVDGSTTVATKLSWPLIGAGFATFYVWADDRVNSNLKKPVQTEDPCVRPFGETTPVMRAVRNCGCGFQFSTDENAMYCAN